MRILVLILSAGLIFPGCALFGPKRNSNQTSTPPEPIIQLANSSPGSVIKVNPKFVVLTFPFGGVPAIGRTLNVYRDEKKVAELKVTGPQRDINTVADIVSGEVQVNDEVRTD